MTLFLLALHFFACAAMVYNASDVDAIGLHQTINMGGVGPACWMRDVVFFER